MNLVARRAGLLNRSTTATKEKGIKSAAGPRRISAGAHTPVSSPARCSRASVTASRRFVLIARPFRNQSRSDNHAFVAERLDLAIKPISRWSGFKADMQPLVSTWQSLDRPLDRQRAVLDVAEKPALSRPPSFRDRDRVLLLGDVESHEDFAILSYGPPSVHEARLGMREQPSFLPARKGGHRLSPQT